MSDLTDDIIDGACCEVCMMYFVRAHGYPVLCVDCFAQEGKSDTPKATYPIGRPRSSR